LAEKATRKTIPKPIIKRRRFSRWHIVATTPH
jgi:hypothetical protein